MPQQIPALPWELLKLIFAHVAHNPSLCANSMTYEALQAEAQRSLFRNPCIPNNRSIEYKYLRFLETIIESPERLARLVISYTERSIWTTTNTS